MSGAVKYKPFVLLTVTTLRDEITLSMCVRGNEEDNIIDFVLNLQSSYDKMQKNK